VNCSTAERYLDAFADGEVDASAGIEVERHLGSCAACAERLAFSGWLKDQLKKEAAEKAPDSLRTRMESAFQAERGGGPAPKRLDASWRQTAAAAAVALCVFGLGGALELKGPSVSAGMAPIFEDVVRAHTRAYPSEVAKRDEVPRYFERKVGFAVHPVEFGDPSVRFVGARDIEVGGRHAATLQYDANGRRLTVVAFQLPAHVASLGEEATALGRSVRYVRVMGHVVPVVEHDGVLYAVMGDLAPEDRLMMAARASLR